MINKTYIMILFACFLGFCLPVTAGSATQKKTDAKTGEPSQTIPEARFRESFIQYLSRYLEKNQSDIIVSEFKVMRNVPVPAGKVSIRLFQKGNKELAEYVKLKAVVSVNGSVKSKVELRAWVDVFEQVVCASRDLKSKEIIQKQDLHLERINISHLSNDVTGDLNSVVGLMVKHRIRADRCIKAWMVQKPYIVERGDMVRILAESGTLKITAPGKTMDKGYHGEVIRVQNIMSQKTIYAKVMSSSIVKVDF